MRREQKKNKILIILILLSGFCTILSFVFKTLGAINVFATLTELQ